MALRVLLADESSTIKKVFQLALQDFAVEVRPVNIGVDVASVAMGFKPDIIFADVLLQKKNGYEVCAELKQDAQLRDIPIVLMWSGFMELDEDKFGASQANAQLEKPFDVAALRKLVTDLVPRTQSSRLSQFLSFPKATADAEKPAGATAKKPDDDFKQVPIPKMKGGASNDKYRLNLNADELDPRGIAVDYELPSDSVMLDDMRADGEDIDGDEEFSFNEKKKPAASVSPPVQAKAAAPPLPPIPTAVPPAVPPAKVAAPAPKPTPAPAPAPKAPAMPLPEEVDLDMELDEEKSVNFSAPSTEIPIQGGLSAAQLEKIIREQSAEVIEAVVWKVIPELATQIIERELNKLLKERDSHPF